MFYPKNFPRHLEKALIQFLLLLESEFKKKKVNNQKQFNRLIYQLMSKKEFSSQFQGQFPSLWWLNFILLRYQKFFSSKFRNKISKFLIKAKIRSLSGIIPLAVFTKGKGCPFHCLYCPNQKNIPKSYFNDEPAVMRAQINNYDPFNQTKSRLTALALSGHPIDKVEIIVKGGTFSSYSQAYRRKFVKGIFDAANLDIIQLLKTGKTKVQPSQTLKQAQKINEKAPSRIVGINIETRPDLINEKEVKFLRKLGVTHVEIGVQALDDSLLKLIQRGHNVAAVKKATFLLKEAGFKITYHLMPNLPGSSPKKDLALLKKVFKKDFSPDHLKIYPTVITRFSQLASWFQKGQYQPYSLEKLINLLVRFKSKVVPPWVRISRLSRDITKQMMIGPEIPSNLRQIVQQKMKKLRLFCSCIRCREIRGGKITEPIKLKIASYPASDGKEYFLEFTDKKNHCLGFLRLRIPAFLLQTKIKPPFSSLEQAALVRELHVYGPVASLKPKPQKKIQHQGLGRKLIAQAEKIAKKEGAKKLAIISGVGVRNYYRSLGYHLRQTYMVKILY